MDSGLQGSGIMSSGPNTPESSTMRFLISESTMRSRSLSKFSLRPTSCTGWKVTPRTQCHSSAWRTISPISSSLTPRFTVTISVVVGAANRAGEIAVLVDLDQRQARDDRAGNAAFDRAGDAGLVREPQIRRAE